MGVGYEGFVAFGAVGAGVEGGAGFVLLNAGGEGLPVGGGDVWGVGDDGVVGFVGAVAE